MEEKLSAQYIDSREGILLRLAVGFAESGLKTHFDQVEKSTNLLGLLVHLNPSTRLQVQVKIHR